MVCTWKGKEESYPGALNTSTSFDEFLNTQVKSALSQPRSWGLLSGSDDVLLESYQGLFTDYLSKTLVPPVATKVDQLTSSSLPSTAHYIPPARMPMPGLFPTAEDITTPSPLPQVSSPGENPMSELLQIYKRLKKTIRLNQVYSNFSHPPETIASEELVHTDSLIRSFGFSIASVEIAQRGVQSEPGATLLDKIPQLTLTHLRVLAETLE